MRWHWLSYFIEPDELRRSIFALSLVCRETRAKVIRRFPDIIRIKAKLTTSAHFRYRLVRYYLREDVFFIHDVTRAKHIIGTSLGSTITFHQVFRMTSQLFEKNRIFRGLLESIQKIAIDNPPDCLDTIGMVNVNVNGLSLALHR